MNNRLKSKIIKKVLYKSSYRGCKETDLILGNFVKDNIDKFTENQLEVLLNILEFDDADIYDWYTNKKPIPDDFNSEMLQMIMAYKLASKEK